MDPNQPQQPDNTSPNDQPTGPEPAAPWTPADETQGTPGPAVQPGATLGPESVQPMNQPGATPPAPMPQPDGTFPPAPAAPGEPGQFTPPPMPPVPNAQPLPPKPPAGPGPASQAGFPPTPPQPNYGEPSPTSSRKKIIFITLAVIVLGGLGYGIYYLTTHTHASNKNATNQAVSQSRSASGTASLTNMRNVSLQEPAADKLGGLTFVPGSNNENSLVNSGATCSIAYGTPPQSVLPGTDIGDVIAKISNSLENQGITVGKPITTNPIVLHNSTTSQKYSLPTVTFKYSKGTVNLVAIYSIAELADQSHAVILQLCYGTDSFDVLSQRAAQQLTPVAEAITVKTQ